MSAVSMRPRRARELEENDFAARLVRSGGRILADPHAAVVHPLGPPADAAKMLRRRNGCEATTICCICAATFATPTRC